MGGPAGPMASSQLLCAALCACLLPCCAAFGDKEGAAVTLRDFVPQLRGFVARKELPCFVTVQPEAEGSTGDAVKQ